jgi:hypothetical protein
MGAIAVALATYLMSQWLSLTSLFAELIPLLMVLGFGLPFLPQATSTAALTGIEGTTLPGANTLLSVSRSAVSSLAVAGLVNLVQAQRLVHQAALAHNGPVSAAVTQQAQALAYQDVYLLSALVTLPLLVLAFFLSSQRRTQKPEPTTTFGVSAHISENSTPEGHVSENDSRLFDTISLHSETTIVRVALPQRSLNYPNIQQNVQDLLL